MKRYGLITILLGLGATFAFSQDSIVTIPDNAFLLALIEEGVDTNGDSLISYGEAERITSLTVFKELTYEGCWGNSNISSLMGIEAFKNLDTLRCPCGNIGTLDLSGNLKIKYLNCSENLLTSLDVSNNTALTILNCSGNQLTNLDVSNNTALGWLNCSESQLTSLDVSNNTGLWYNENVRLGLKLKGLLKINNIPSLYQVCVPSCLPWDGEGCMPDSIEDWQEHVSSYGSPNVYFTTNCSQ